MYVLHACWLATAPIETARWALWGEDSTGSPTAPRRRGRRLRVQDHPYAISIDQLADVFGLSTTAGTTDTLALQLPGTAEGPQPSPELVRETITTSSGDIAAGAWRVPVLIIDSDAAFAWLRSQDRRDRIDHTAGPSVQHLNDVLDFAADLVGRGRLLPTLDTEPALARWQPVLVGADASWARVLASAAPPSLIAATNRDEPAQPRDWADLLDNVTDAAARAALGSARLTVGRGGSPALRAWLSALTGPDRHVKGLDRADAAALAEAITTWQADAFAGPVRACLRLTEPREDSETWTVQLGLQDGADPSSVVDAATVWASQGTLPGLGRHLEAPQETFLTELGKAARLYPDLDDALRTARPQELTLDTAAAHRFLLHDAPALVTSGFGVQLPGWWTSPSARLGLKIKASTPVQPGLVAGSSSGVGAEAIAGFRYDLALGSQDLTDDELAELAATKAPLVRLRGQWIEVDSRRLAAGLKLAGRSQQTTVGDLLRLALGVADGPDELPITEVTADGWLGVLLDDAADRRLEPVEPPAGFTGRLRPYQSRGLSWLTFLDRTGLGGVLADDMGLGKTVQLLALLAAELDRPADERDDRPTLLICPMSLVGNWQREAARFTPELRVHVHHGAERVRGRAFAGAVADADLVITTYALAARDAAALRAIDWRRMVVDEAQAIKNAATKQATAIRSIPAGGRIAVTGTPVENRLADLWSILEFANPGMLGSAAGFKKRFAEPIEKHGDDEAAERLRRFTGPFILRRLKTDSSIIADLPEKLEMDLVCNLTTEQGALYQAVVDDMLDKIDNSTGIERRGLVLATMTKLKQVCNHPAHFLRDGSRLPGRSGKLERLDEILEEVLAAGEKALLFTQYAEFGNLLRAHLTGRFGREVLFLHGGVSKAGRDEMVARFQSDDRWSPPIFVLSLKAGGTGLTLTAANHVVHVDRWWNPAVEDQATDRAYRIGQRRAVQVRKLVCAGTMEEKVATMITEKRELAAKIVGTGEQWLTELSTTQLADLVRLETGAVVE
ncbi:MAG TPA: DEAD/DEAH box helicase [Microlunatus sp.]|nr:DEAD/DEAH box helicase [Microlunatus sp.]